MQFMGDLESKESSKEMQDKILLRDKINKTVALLVPTMHAQLSFNKLANTNMISHLDFINALTKFHEKLRLDFYPDIFDQKSADSIDWTQYQAKFYKPNRNFNWFEILLPTFLMTILMGTIAIIKLKQL